VPQADSGIPLHELSGSEIRLRGELHRAIRKGDIDRRQALEKRGAPLNVAVDLRYGEKGTWVDWACVNGHPELGASLLALADRHGLGSSLAAASKASLLWSATMGHLDLLRELLRRKADVDMRCPGPTPRSLLAQAVYSAQPEATLELLRRGAWEKEPAPQREHLLSFAQSRAKMAAVFREAGVGNRHESLPFIQ